MKKSFDFKKHQLTKLSKRFLVRILFYAIVIGIVVYYTLFLTQRIDASQSAPPIKSIEGIETITE